ncbi:MAG: TIGR02556 family CRISPR-associated protein [Thermodesulfobacteriota bacterium]|nr:TIGR02556 family CRISPR-associated protein [Thermodesulfobacteriota bacterium]
MINAIAELGRFEKNKNPDLTSFDIWLEDSFDNGKYPNLLLIKFIKEDSKWTFGKIDVWENSTNLRTKLLYKRGASRGIDKTPTSKVATSIERTLNQKIIGWFESNKNKKFLSTEEKKFLNEISEEIKEKKEDISKALSEKAEIMDSNAIVLSPVFAENGNQKFIGDYEFFKKFITEETKQGYKYSKTFKKHAFSKNETCSVCNKVKDEVFGFFTSLASYTVDKPGMVSGGFQQDKSWKNYPVCLDCALDVEIGIKLMDQELSFKFYGFSYYLIPRTITKRASEDIIDSILDFKKSPRINAADRERLTNDENDVFEILQEEQNNVALNLVFYAKPQKGVLRILAVIEEVLPSRIRQLFDAKHFTDNIVFLKGHKTKENKDMFRFSFGTLRTFLPNNKIEGNNDKSFLELTRMVFSDIKIDYQFILHQIISHIRNNFVQNQAIWFQTIQGFMLIIYLNKLNLLRKSLKEADMDHIFFDSFKIESKEELEEKTELFFSNFKEFFETDAHSSIFLIGVLAQFLLNIQQQERNTTPFRSRLKGLKMNSRDISVLLPEIIEKIEQYKKQYSIFYQYKEVADLASKYLISSGNFRNWNIPVDEMNFIFVLGMNLSQYFKIKSKTNKDNKQKEDGNE